MNMEKVFKNIIITKLIVLIIALISAFYMSDEVSQISDNLSGGILFNDDIASLSNSLLTQNVISDYQWWAGDLDFDEDNTIFDFLLLVDLLQN